MAIAGLIVDIVRLNSTLWQQEGMMNTSCDLVSDSILVVDDDTTTRRLVVNYLEARKMRAVPVSGRQEIAHHFIAFLDAPQLRRVNSDCLFAVHRSSSSRAILGGSDLLATSAARKAGGSIPSLLTSNVR